MISIIAIISVLFIAGCSSQIEETQPEMVEEGSQVPSGQEEVTNEENNQVNNNQEELPEDVQVQIDNTQQGEEDITESENYNEVLSYYVELGCSQANTMVESGEEIAPEQMNALALEAAENNNLNVDEANTLVQQYTQNPQFDQEALEMIMNTCPDDYNSLMEMMQTQTQ